MCSVLWSNESIDSWAIIKNGATLLGIKILATVTKNWLKGPECWPILIHIIQASGRFQDQPGMTCREGLGYQYTCIFTGLTVYWAVGLSRTRANVFLRFVDNEKRWLKFKERKWKEKKKHNKISTDTFLKFQILSAFFFAVVKDEIRGTLELCFLRTFSVTGYRSDTN